MKNFIIEGGRALKGEVTIQGSKNATLPILAATLLTKQVCIIDRVPRIEDVLRMIEIMGALGAKVEWLGDNTLKVEAKEIDAKRLPQEIVGRFRASILLIGPLLARCGRMLMTQPGGCQIGVRGVDTHLTGFRELGVEVGRESFVIGAGDEALAVDAYNFDATGLRGGEVVLPEFSVTATENILLAAAALEEETVIKVSAMESHVQDLCRFLSAMGADIQGIGTHTLRIKGRKILKGVQHKLIPDVLDMGAFLVAAAVTRGEILIKGVISDHCDSVLAKAKEMGVDLSFESAQGGLEGNLMVKGKGPFKSAKIQSMPFPGFPTDLQALFGLLATQAEGTSIIHDPLFEGRLRYLDELRKMGASTFIADSHRAVVYGPTPLSGREIQTFDIRAGATLVVAGLAASGRTILHNSYQIDRGYEKLAERLGALGGRIKR